MSQRNGPTEQPQEVTLHVFRHDPGLGPEWRFDSFRVPIAPHMSVLEALFYVRDHLDPTLTFRYACRGAVCGSCAMTVNGRCDLACRVQVLSLPDREATVEPLPNLEIQRDLAVDLEPFWKAYEAVQPWLQPAEEPPERERLVSEAERGRVDEYVNCILCACCYGACPIPRREGRYLGPAALAKAYRFLVDARDARPVAVLRELDRPEGVWGCDMVHECIRACPKAVRPSYAIAGLRRRLVGHRLRSLVGAKRREA